ncbi:glycosyltransferase family 2 protein [Gilliamella sp. G0441]|uniref:glycosyltransferase family 2 protein n=1 Tax=Gilliamella sp. G0441 TaxID=3384760 RepID=UPI003D33B871
MNNIPLISVIIPVYNTREVIERTLKSIENQTFQNYQIILIDDGSTDGTGRFIDEYQKKNNKTMVFHQTNSGVSASRNKGIEKATGEFICFLDSDDTYAPTFFEKMLMRQQETNSNIVYCGFYRTRKNEKIKENCVFNEGNILKSFLEKSFHISGMLFRKTFLIKNKIVFDANLNVCEDIFFTIKAISCSDVVVVKEHLFNYLYRSQSVTNSIATIELFRKNIETWSHIQFFLNQNYNKQDHLQVKKIVQAIVVKLKVRLLIEYLKNYDYNRIRDYLNNDYSFTDSIKIADINFLSKSDLKKLRIVKSNNLIKWFWGSLYYRYIRPESGK